MRTRERDAAATPPGTGAGASPRSAPAARRDGGTRASRVATALLALAAVAAVAVAVVFGGAARRSLTAPAARLVPSVAAKPAPELTGIRDWLNSEPLTMSGLRGKVVLVEFWKYTCLNCRHEMPYIAKLHETYAARGLVVLGVHSPEFDFEKKPANVERASRELNITWPVAQDPDRATWDAFQTQYWPSMYLVDRAGRIRYATIGQGSEENTEEAIRELLADGGDPGPRRVVQNGVSGAHAARALEGLTPELFLAGPRGEQGLAAGVVAPGTTVERDDGGDEPHRVHLRGPFTGGAESVAAAASGARLDLRYHAKDVYAVIQRPHGARTANVEILLDGLPVPAGSRGPDVVERDGRTYVRLDSDTIRHVVRATHAADGNLTLVAHTAGVRFFVLKFRA